MKNLELARKIIKELSNTKDNSGTAIGNILSFFRSALSEQGVEDQLLIPTDAKSEIVNFENRDGQSYEGIIFQNNNSKKWVVGLHGYSSSKESMAHLIWFMKQFDYNLFLFDFRNHGRSFSDQTTFGIKEKDDLVAALDFLCKNYHVESAGLYGASMGAYVLNYFALTESELIKKYHLNFGISDSTYHSIYELMTNLSIAKWPVIRATAKDVVNDIFEAYELDYNVNLRKGDLDLLTDNASGSFPILFLHGKNDKITSWESSEILFEERHQNQEQDQIKIFDDGPHVRSFVQNQESYLDKVKEFLDTIGEL